MHYRLFCILVYVSIPLLGTVEKESQPLIKLALSLDLLAQETEINKLFSDIEKKFDEPESESQENPKLKIAMEKLSKIFEDLGTVD